MTLATTADVEALLQIDITDDADPKIVALLEMADGLVEAELGRPVAGGVTITAELHQIIPERLVVGVHRWPIASIEAVTEDGTALTEGTNYRASLTTGTIERLTDNGYPRYWPRFGTILISYTTGVLPAARTVCAQAVARAFRAGANFAAAPPALAGLKQLTVGRWSATALTETGQIAAEALSLTDRERATIHAYRDRRP